MTGLPAGASRACICSEDLSERIVARIAERTLALKGPGDILIASIHWGGNWGYEVPAQHSGSRAG